jgi:hypothetical protein
MAIEIVDFPIKNGGSFHCFLYVYQRVLLVTHANSRTLASSFWMPRVHHVLWWLFDRYILNYILLYCVWLYMAIYI